jgi:hypothetical protein
MMKITVLMQIEMEDQAAPIVVEVATLERGELTPETLGLTLAEAKTLLAQTQAALVTHQVAAYGDQQRSCPRCGARQPSKGQHTCVLRTLFGKLTMPSPRLVTRPCQNTEQRSFSPVADLLRERTTPELRYLQAKWASLVSYGVTIDLLEEVLPIHVSQTSLIRQVQQVAKRLEDELGEEQACFIDGCQRDWDRLPIPDGPLTVGIDGGYVHARDGDREQGGLVRGHRRQEYPHRRRRQMLWPGHELRHEAAPPAVRDAERAGDPELQTVTFLSDGGENVRELQLYLSPQAEHLLDWFHVTMRLTVLQQLRKELGSAASDLHLDEVAADLDRIKWLLWHGNVFRTLQLLDDLHDELDVGSEETPAATKLTKAVHEFHGYIAANKAFIPNYGDRYRHGERIATGFVASTVNQVVSKRMVKQQQMRWTKRGAHLLLQVRTQVLNEDLRTTFGRWRPGMASTDAPVEVAV